jgi:transcription elongation GreA/GreB family factor
MNVENLVKLVGSGNVKNVEEAWLGMFEEPADASKWLTRTPILKALIDNNREAEAETLATTALEQLAGNLSAEDHLRVGAEFLLAFKNAAELRKAVADLYRQAHGDIEGLEELLKVAGVEAGRPPRRAIRTMDVGVRLQADGYLAHRHDHSAARVISIDRTSWDVEVETGDGPETLSVVELADNYEPALEDDVRVLAQFQPDRLASALRDDPGAIIVAIVRGYGRTIDSDTLKARLCPEFIPEKEWTKWWTRARAAIRQSPNLKLEGRAPYFLTYTANAPSFAQEIEARLLKAHEAQKEFALVEEYIRGCKARKEEPDAALLRRTRERIEERARRTIARTGKVELLPWLIAQRIGELAGDEDAGQHVVDALQKTSNPAAAIMAVEDPAFWPAACTALEKAHPDNLREALEQLLPHAPIRVADDLARHLVELGYTSADFRRMADEVVRDPVTLNEGLLWLWSGPSVAEARTEIPLITLLTRMLHAMGEVRRRDGISREHIKRIQQNTRDVLKARDFARFRQMLEQIEPGVAMALRTQINRLDNLGRLSDDLMRLLRRKFPKLSVEPTAVVPRWLQEDVLYVTDEGYRRKSAEREELIHVKIRQNAIAIGKAAELGDLSENSEYKFALEERDLLQARLAQINKQMDMCRVLTPREVPLDHVGIGSRVTLQHVASGVGKTITILGPWEADPDHGIYNYLTPLAQLLLGKQIGETVNMEFFEPAGEYRITDLAVAIEDKSAAPS